MSSKMPIQWCCLILFYNNNNWWDRKMRCVSWSYSSGLIVWYLSYRITASGYGEYLIQTSSLFFIVWIFWFPVNRENQRITNTYCVCDTNGNISATQHMYVGYREYSHRKCHCQNNKIKMSCDFIEWNANIYETLYTGSKFCGNFPTTS